jgi:Sds3-like
MTSTAITQPSLGSGDAVISRKFKTKEDQPGSEDTSVVVDGELNGNGKSFDTEEPSDRLDAQRLTKIASSPPPILNHKFSDDSSELSELDDSEAETERLEPLDDSELGPPPPTLSHKRRREPSDSEREMEDGKAGDWEEEEQSRRTDDSMKKRKSVRNGKRSTSVEDDEDNEDEGTATGNEQRVDNDIDLKHNGIVNNQIDEESVKNSVKTLRSESESEVEPKESKQEKELEESRQRAIVQLTEIEVEFAKLRDQLHDDKMARFVAEIEMCADGTHPELSKVHSQITRIRDEKIQLAERKRAYQQKCIDNQIRAMRDHLHQQFMKDEAECRVRLLLHTTEEWYKVNKERRAMDALAPEFSYQVPERRSTQIQNRVAINGEISLLSGISNYIGFPAAPEMNPANESELLEDLEALGIQY